MNTIAKALFPVILGISVAATAMAAEPSAALPKGKNWAPPAHKIYAQTLSDEIMQQHPELLSVTFHGVPPGHEKVYTMFAGSFPERIGNIDDVDDVMIIEKGITIIDPRWNRNDTPRKFVMMLPLRDASGGHIGLLVLAYKHPVGSTKGEKDYFVASTALRDDLQKQIPNYAALFAPAK
jgi:hypothetical protein